MKKRISAFLFALLLLFAFVCPVFADTGPKPSVKLCFEGGTAKVIYVTLLAETEHYGPYSVYNENEDTTWRGINEENGVSRDVFMKFVDYEAPEGYYFLQYAARVDMTDTAEFEWSYMPPESFRVLVYDPGTDGFACSERVSCFAFDSVFRVEIGNDLSLSVTENADTPGEVKSFFIRLAVCFAVETVIALCFGYIRKKQLLIVLLTNLVTQILLNVFISVTAYKSGFMSVYAGLVLAELAVFAAESVLYAKTLEKFSPKPRKPFVPVLYALIANAASLLASLLIR